MKKILFTLSLCAAFSYGLYAQLMVVPDSNYTQMVNNFILSGVSASNVQYTGAAFSAGTFSGGSSTNLGLSDGIVLTTGMSDTTGGQPAIGDSVYQFKSFFCNTPGNALLNQLIPGYFTFDAAVLEFDLVPAGNILEFQYVFASEEYPEFVGSSFNDVFGFFISGPDPAGGSYTDTNIAFLPMSGDVVSINTVNAGTNASYFVDNQAIFGGTIVFDGFTTVLLAQIPVVPGQNYHLMMGVADAGDGIFDSGVFLKAQSMKSYMITGMESPAIPAVSVIQNPITDASLLQIGPGNHEPNRLVITDLTARRVLETEFISGESMVNLPLGQWMQDMPSGTYLISVSNSKGISFRKVLKP